MCYNGDDIDRMIEFVKSTKSDHSFIKSCLIRAGIYDENMQLTAKYRRVEEEYEHDYET